MKFLVTDDSKLARLSLVKVINTLWPDAEIFQAENGQVAVETFEIEKQKLFF